MPKFNTFRGAKDLKLGNNFNCDLSKIKSPKGPRNCLILEKTHVKLFPNFTHHHLITNTNRHSQNQIK